MAGRRDDAAMICELAGSAVVQVVDLGNGWPAHVRVRTGDAWRDVSLFAAPIGTSARNKDDTERRFQNPGSDRPMVFPEDHLPMYVGLWVQDRYVNVQHPVIVSAEVLKRAGAKTRASVFPQLSALMRASLEGSAEHRHGDELLFYMWPAFLSVAAQARDEGVAVPAREITQATEAAGISSESTEEDAVERVRKLGSRLIRDAKFRREVMDAYGWRCALCGLSAGLVEAAHIYPASAPDAPDVITNGVALCRNHHRAFDRCAVWIDPQSGEVRLHPEFLDLASKDEAVARFVSMTYDSLAWPQGEEHRPSPIYFEKRYSYEEIAYNWTV